MAMFDQDFLERQLAEMAPARRAVFALSCAERLLPVYNLYSKKTGRGDPVRLHSTLDCFWDNLMTHAAPCPDNLYDYDLLMPNERSPWDALNPLAENAVAAAVYACRCVKEGNISDAVWAAVQCYEAADYIAHTTGGIEFTGPEAEKAILNSAVVQAELAKQIRDLQQIGKSDSAGFAGLWTSLRMRAMSDGHEAIEALRTLAD